MDVLGIGLFLITRREKSGLAVIALVGACFLFIFGYVQPTFRYPYHVLDVWNYYSHLTSFTWDAWLRVFTPNPVLFLFKIFGPFLFLSFFCKGWFWLLGPSLALRLLNSYPFMLSISHHYTAGLEALIFISAIYGIARITETRSRQNFILILLFLTAFGFSGRPQLLGLEDHMWEASNFKNQRVVNVLETVPTELSVLTNETYSAHLSHRSKLFVFFSMFEHAPLTEDAKKPDVIIVDEKRINSKERGVVSDFITNGYRKIYEIPNMTIYERPSQERVISQKLLLRWEIIKNSEVLNYRKIFRLWYKIVFILVSVFYFAILLFKLLKPLFVSSKAIKSC